MTRTGKKTAWRHLVTVLFAGGVLACGFTLQGDDTRSPTRRSDSVNASIKFSTGVLSGTRLPVAAPTHAYRLDTVIAREGSGFLPQSVTREEIDAMGGSVAGLVCRFDEQCDDCSGCTVDVCVIPPGQIEGVCASTPVDLCENCDDGLFCNGRDRCNGSDDACVSDGDPCANQPEICDEQAGDSQAGACVTACQTDADCADNVADFCKSPEVCQLQECVGGDNPGQACSSGAECTNGFCGGVCRETEGPCGDGAPCVAATQTCGFGRCCNAGVCSRDSKPACETAGGDWLGIGDFPTTQDADDADCAIIAPSTEPNVGEDFQCPAYASGIAPVGDLLVPVGRIGAAACNPFQEIGDDYQIGDGTGFLKLTTFRMVEGFREGSRIRITFYDENGVFVEDSITDPRGGGDVELQTFVFDEQPIIPARGFVTIKAAIRFSPTGKHIWMSTTATPDVGANDPNLLWVNGGPVTASAVLPGGEPGVLAFEIVGDVQPVALGACCDPATGACNLALPWVCQEGGGFFQGVGTACKVCTNDFFQACTVDSECVTCQGGGNDGTTCSSNADCTGGGTCNFGATCVTVPPACTISACCDPADGTCVVVLGGQCPVGTESNGFGTTCEPNCCNQPVMTGGDLCTEATIVPINVPLPGEFPVVITITGDNSAATFGDWLPDGTGTCQAVRHHPNGPNPDRGWWEAFQIDACANVRIDDCCTQEISGEIKQPQWLFLQSTCNPCGGDIGTDIIGVPLGSDITDGTYGEPFCNGDDLWVTYRNLQPGVYWQPIFSAPNGTFGLYQRHITVEACPVAACCLPASMCIDDTSDKVVFVAGSPQLCAVDSDCGAGASCTTCAILNELDCSAVEGFFNGFGSLPPDADPIRSCFFGACDIGSCCQGPGECLDGAFPGTPCDPFSPLTCMNQALCDQIGGAFQGGEFCDFPIPPCPICPILGTNNCQAPPGRFPGNWNTSDLDMAPHGVVVADDFVPNGGTLSTICFWGHYADQADDGADCDGQVIDKFRIRVYADDGGFPGAIVFEQQVDNFNLLRGPQVGAGPNGVGDAVGYSVILDPPFTGLVQGVRHWLEIANNTDEPEGNTCVWSWQMFLEAGRDEFSMMGTNDRPNQGAGSGYLREGSARPVDYAFCLGQGGGPLDFTQPDPQEDTMSCWDCFDQTCTPETLRACIGGTNANDGNLPAQDFRGGSACTDFAPPEQEGQFCLAAGAIAGLGSVCNGGAPNGLLEVGEECDDGDDTDPFDGCTGCLLTCDDTAPPPGGNGAKLIGNGLFSFDNTCAPSDGSPTVLTDFGETAINNSVWFHYIATCTGRLVASACPTGVDNGGFDSVIALYRDPANPTTCVCPGTSNQFLDGVGADENCNGNVTGQAGFLERSTENGWCWTVRVGGWAGDFGNGLLDVDCEPAACKLSSPPVIEHVVNSSGGTVASIKNRYLSFSAGDPGQTQGIRIKIITAPIGLELWIESTFWVGAPRELSELGGKDDATPPTFTAAQAECSLSSASFTQWSSFGTIHVSGPQIVPGATYEITVVDSSCNLCEVDSFRPESTAVLVTSAWGDVAGSFRGIDQTWSAPDGNVSVSFDVVAILDKFKNVPTAPKKARADISPNPVEGKITIVDVTRALDAFSGAPFPFAPVDPTTPCPFLANGTGVCVAPPPLCGNGSPDPGEQCDDGNTVSGDGCSSNCTNEPVCGNGVPDPGEECDDGSSNSNTVPDACRLNCTNPRCGDGVVDTGEACDPPDGFTCGPTCQFVPPPPPATAVVSLVPVRASGTHTLDATGSEITLTGGGQQVVLDLMVAGWDVDMDGFPTLRAWETAIDSQGFASGLQGVLARVDQACATGQDCVSAFGGACNFTGALCTQDSECSNVVPTDTCIGAPCVGGRCPPGFILNQRSDYVFSGVANLGGVDLVGSDVRFGAAAQSGSGVTDPGEPRYLGTLVLDVPLDASGTFTVGPVTAVSETMLTDANSAVIPLAGIEPALITVNTNACCQFDGTCSSPVDADACIAGGGTGIAACAGDNNNNSINDACEEVGCCVSGTCTLTTRAACKDMVGSSVCDCVGDNNGNGSDDACEACTVAAPAPLAEDGGFGPCLVDLDCPGVTSCIGGVCYVPKNRYLGFRPNNPDSCTALEIQLTEHRRCDGSGVICRPVIGCLVGETCAATVCEGTTWYVGEPERVVHNGQAFWISTLSTEPVFRNWSELVIHVADLGIVPAARYSIRAIAESCFGDETKFSVPLELPTTFSVSGPGLWGDVVGAGPGDPTVPDGQTTILDILAILNSYQAEPDAVPLPRVDLMRAVPDRDVSIRDVLADLRAFTGRPYPGPPPCGVIPSAATAPDEAFAGPTPALTCSLFDLAGNPAAAPRRVLPSAGSLVLDVFINDAPALAAYQAQVNVSASDGRGFCLGDPATTCTVGAGDCSFGVCDAGTCDVGELPDESPCCVSVGGATCQSVRGACSVSAQDCPDGSRCVSNLGVCDTGVGTCAGDGSACLGTCAPEARVLCCEDPIGIEILHTTGGEFDFDFIYFAAETRFLLTNCADIQIAGVADPGESGIAAPAYLGTFVMDISNRAGGGSFDVVIEKEDANEEVSMLIIDTEGSEEEDSIPFTLSAPCVTFEVALDCNRNDCPDDCDLDSAACNTPQCQDFPGCVTACGNSADCNGNSIPDECEIRVSSPAVPPAPFTQFFCARLCVGCPETCICSNTMETCSAGCNCLTGEGCEVGCDATCTGDVVCDPDCNDNGIPDACDISSAMGNPDFQDCQPNGIPDGCDIDNDPSLDCQPNRVPDFCDNRDCADDDEVTCGDCDGDGLLNVCEIDVNEQDCDGSGVCNACALSCVATVNGRLCSDLGTCGLSIDCHNMGDEGFGVPDACDIADATSLDCQNNGIPDECDLCIGGDPCCDDCDGNGVPDSCDILSCSAIDPDCHDTTGNAIPDFCDIRDGTSCDVIAPDGETAPDDVPDETTLVCAAGRSVCSSFHFPEVPDGFESVSDPVASLGAALKIVWLNGTSTMIGGLTGPATISRREPHFHGDAVLDTQATGEPCVMPSGFADLDTWRGREVHLEIETLSLSNGSDALTLGAEESLGEAQGTCADFPAETFFNLFLSVTVATPPAPLPSGLTLTNPTPVIVQAILDADLTNAPNFDWSLPTVQSVFQNDTSAPAVPLIDADGVHRGYLVNVRLGDGTLAPDVCDVAVGLGGSISFVVDGATEGILINPPATTNHVKDDKDAGATQRTRTVYTALGAAPGGFVGSFLNTNARVDALIGSTGGVTPFVTGDAINSLSFGRDGTNNAGAPSSEPVLYYSVDNASEGTACGGLDLSAPGPVAPRNRSGADVYMSAFRAFGDGNGEGPISPQCTEAHGGCLVADQTTVGLGPFAIDPVGQEGRGLADNIAALETSSFPGDRAYFTFTPASGSQLIGEQATIYLFDATANPNLEFANLRRFATKEQLGLQINDVIDALAVSDVGATGCATEPCGEQNVDSVLFSLAPNSPTLLDNSLSPADIFRSRLDGTETTSAFATAESLGLLPTDNIDAIDVGVALVDVDCDGNAISDVCDIARGFDQDSNTIPDACDTVCLLAPPPQPQPELIRFLSDEIEFRKNRYISFTAGEPGRMQAIRVTFKSMPSDFSFAQGRTMWVGQPEMISEVAGTKPASEAPNKPGFAAAELQCEPFFGDWHGVCGCNNQCVGGAKQGAPCNQDADCLGVINVFGREIVPSTTSDLTTPDAVYEVQIVDIRCDAEPTPPESSFSAGLEIPMARWGDIVKNCKTTPCGPPDGRVGVALDVVAVLDKFPNRPGAPIKTRADLRGPPPPPGSPDPKLDSPDRKIDILDITAALDAAGGRKYPFSGPSVNGCPP